MEVIKEIQQLKQLLNNQKQMGKSIGFVPTMGYLHEGHLSLIRAARSGNDITVLSIFVNPLQFGPNEDFDNYPRDEAKDLSLAEQAGIDVVFLPTVQEMYPKKLKTTIHVGDITTRLCGASRPGHFDGVATVVLKLFHIVEPHRAYFGLKDAQQVAVISQMVEDLNLPVEVVPRPIIREMDGLALSSRNVYLQAKHRQEALVLNQSLQSISEWIQAGLTNADQLTNKLKTLITTTSSAVIDYVEILSYPSLQPIFDLKEEIMDKQVIVALAVKFGNTRLIDNRILNTELLRFSKEAAVCSEH